MSTVFFIVDIFLLAFLTTFRLLLGRGLWPLPRGLREERQPAEREISKRYELPKVTWPPFGISLEEASEALNRALCPKELAPDEPAEVMYEVEPTEYKFGALNPSESRRRVRQEFVAMSREDWRARNSLMQSQLNQLRAGNAIVLGDSGPEFITIKTPKGYKKVVKVNKR